MDDKENTPQKPKLPVRPNRIALRPSPVKPNEETSEAATMPPEPAAAPTVPTLNTPSPPSEPEGIRPPPSIFDKTDLPAYADEMFGRSTMRIELPAAADKKRETTRIDLPPAAKKETAKIELPPAAAEKSKSTTMALGVPVAPPPGPSKPKRPGSLIVKRPAATPGAGESTLEESGKTSKITGQARSNETARLDVPADQQGSADEKPKTIRIKRPEPANAKKPLAIARPKQGKKTTAATLAEPDFAEEEENEAPSLLAGITAIAALLVAGFLFYMLLTQSIAPGLPFPGKI